MKIVFEHFYIFAALLFFALSFVSNEALDIAIHDTYFVIAHQQIAYLISIYFVLFAGFIFLFRKWGKALNKTIVCLHFFATTITLFGFIVLQMKIAARTKDYQDMSVFDEIKNSNLFEENQLITFLILIFLLAQLIFFLTVIINSFIRKPNSNTR